jgi:hypothetical protein
MLIEGRDRMEVAARVLLEGEKVVWMLSILSDLILLYRYCWTALSVTAERCPAEAASAEAATDANADTDTETICTRGCGQRG